MRKKIEGHFKDGQGSVIYNGTCTVYLAGTTTLATIYSAATLDASDSAVSGSVVNTDVNGKFTFYVDDFDYNEDQTFKVILATPSTLPSYSITYDNIKPSDNVLGTYTISADKTVTTHITIPKGVIYSVASGKTLTFSGSLQAGPYQIFSGAGTVAGLDRVVPEWFGSTGDGTADDTTAVTNAIAACANGTWDTTGYTYIVSNSTISGNVKIIGSGTIKHKAAATDHMLEVTGSLSLQDVTIDGNKANQTGRYSAIYFSGTKLSAERATFQNTVASGIKDADGEYLYIDGCQFLDMAEHGGTLGQTSYGIDITQATTDTFFSIKNSKFVNSAPSGNGYSSSAVYVHGAQSNKVRGVMDNLYANYCGQNRAGNNTAAFDLYQLADYSTLSNITVENAGWTAIGVSDSGNTTIFNPKITDAHYNVGQPAIYIQPYNHATTLKHNHSIIGGKINWQYGDGIRVQGAAGQLPTGTLIDGTDIENATYGVYLYYVSGATLSNVDIKGSVNEGVRIRASEGTVKIISGSIKDTTEYHVRTYDAAQASLDLHVTNVTFDNADTSPGVYIHNIRNVIYTGNTHLNSTTVSYWIKDCTGKVIIGDSPADIAPDISGNTLLEMYASPHITTGGYRRVSVEAASNIEGDASTTIGLNIPVRAKLLSAQLRVDTALTAGETWSAAYSGGNTQTIAANEAVAKSTKVDVPFDGLDTAGTLAAKAAWAAPITTNTTNIAITKYGGGSFTAAGNIRAIVHYEIMNPMADAP
jgi:hypothetical protein